MKYLTSKLDIHAVLRVLNDREDIPVARNQAALYLRRSPLQPELAEHLVHILRDPKESELMRKYAVQHLTYAAQDAQDETKRQWVVSRIEEALNDRSDLVRCRALRALTRLENPRVLEVSERLLLDNKESSVIRQTAIHTIGHFKARQHIAALRLLAEGHEDIDIRIAAIAVLGDFRDAESRAVFEAAARSKRYGLKSAGQVALRKILGKPR